MEVNLLDVQVFVVITALISLYGMIRAKMEQTQKQSIDNELVGQNMSLFWIALSVCSTYISAISLLGFPAEVYYRGTMMYCYAFAYIIGYPICAYIFLPVFYNLKLKSLYEYLERRFSVTSRLIASSTFIVQTLLYESAALYAPALALTSLIPIPTVAAIAVTASLSAFYLYVGGARAGIFTSSLQMLVIFVSLMFITVTPLFYWNFSEIITNAKHGGRFIFNDVRIDPRVRHSVFPLLLGGIGNILSLYATNQLTLQRYLCLPTLRKAQKSIILNAPFNILILSLYIIIGIIIYGVYHGCHPTTDQQNDLVTNFIKRKMNYVPGIQGVFLAALYSAGVSTLTASYNALTAIIIEDVVKLGLSRMSSKPTLSAHMEWKLAKSLPVFFAICAAFLAYWITKYEAIILQIALSIFGGWGGTILGVFCVGMFCPWIKYPTSAVTAQIAAIIMSFIMMSGSIVNNVKPVNLPLDSTCPVPSAIANLTLIPDEYTTGTVTATNNYFMWWTFLSEISYQYYSIVGVLVCFFVSHFIELLIYIIKRGEYRKIIDDRLLSEFVRSLQPTMTRTVKFQESKHVINTLTVSSKL